MKKDKKFFDMKNNKENCAFFYWGYENEKIEYCRGRWFRIKDILDLVSLNY